MSTFRGALKTAATNTARIMYKLNGAKAESRAARLLKGSYLHGTDNKVCPSSSFQHDAT